MIGHSRTVIGIEEKKNRTLCLLIFDPGCPSREMQKLLKQDVEASSLKQLRKSMGNLKHKQYQIPQVTYPVRPVGPTHSVKTPLFWGRPPGIREGVRH